MTGAVLIAVASIGLAFCLGTAAAIALGRRVSTPEERVLSTGEYERTFAED
jgi:hypothetical protein